jgi:arylsulfatase A-like enzyme/cytochrome c-type biogenesis protein CcmH/NrfG
MRRLRAVGLILLCGQIAFCASTASKKSALPDVFLITIDTLRADHVHCYGYERIATPALDGLANDGIRFSHTFTASPITNTSHASILTGLLPSSHGVTDFGVPLSSDYVTIAELLKEKGYHTAAFIGAVILDSKTLAPGFDRGFDFYDNFPEHPTTKSKWGHLERRGMDVARHAESWLREHPAGPHFLWLHFYDPHDPYEPPEPYSQTYKDRLYDGEIAYADSALENFLIYLKQTGRYQDSIIVVVADHGEGLGEHQENTHGIFLYDSTTHVPLIIKLPRELRAGMIVDVQISTVDILPTITDLAGLSAPEHKDGGSLRPYLDGVTEVDRPAFGQTDYPLRFGWAPLRSVRSDGFKYIEAPRPELYDLHTDAGELENRFEPSNEHVQKAKKLLNQFASNASTSDPPLPDPKDKIEEQNLLHAAMIATENEHAEEATKSLRKVLAIDPDSPTALLQLGQLEINARDFDHAAQHLKTAIANRPADATAWFYEGQALLSLRDLDGAKQALETSLKLQPGHFQARLLLGRIFLDLQNSKAAQDQFEAALLLQPRNVEAQLGVANAESADGEFTQAVQQLELLSKTEKKNPAVFESLAKVYAGLGKSADAKAAAARAKMLRSQNQDFTPH